MSLKSQLCIVLWKNLYIQTIRRHYISLGFELFIVVWVATNVVTERNTSRPKCWLPEKTHDAVGITKYAYGPSVFGNYVYGPPNPYTDKLMEYVIRETCKYNSYFLLLYRLQA